MASLTTARALCHHAPRPMVLLTPLLNAVDYILKSAAINLGPGVRLQAGWQQHLNGADQSHGRVIRSGMRFVILEAAVCNECFESNLVAEGPVARLAAQVLRVDSLHYGREDVCWDVECFKHCSSVVLESVSEDHHRAVAQLWLLWVDRPTEDLTEHFTRVSLTDELGVSKKIAA
jgi:hypothetical protein